MEKSCYIIRAYLGMDTSSNSASFVPSRSLTSMSPSPSAMLPSGNQLKPTRVHFQVGDNVLLLCKVVAVEHPFV